MHLKDTQAVIRCTRRGLLIRKLSHKLVIPSRNFVSAIQFNTQTESKNAVSGVWRIDNFCSRCITPDMPLPRQGRCLGETNTFPLESRTYTSVVSLDIGSKFARTEDELTWSPVSNTASPLVRHFRTSLRPHLEFVPRAYRLLLGSENAESQIARPGSVEDGDKYEFPVCNKFPDGVVEKEYP